MSRTTHVVTGAFGYSGARMAALLQARGIAVRTLSNKARPQDSAGSDIEIAPLAFERRALCRALQGAEVLYNTYWVRFPHGGQSHSAAVENSRTLFQAAREAGVRRVVHVSITNSSLDSSLSYFRGKAEVELALQNSGLEHSILRPALLFGGRDVLINNIAWLLRRLPLFGLVAGDYGVQPIHVDDLARLAIEEGCHPAGFQSRTVDAVGPEVLGFRDLVERIAGAVQSRARIFTAPRWVVLGASRVLSLYLRDVLLTADEVEGLCQNLLVTDSAATGEIRFTRWLEAEAASLGLRYANELNRHYR